MAAVAFYARMDLAIFGPGTFIGKPTIDYPNKAFVPTRRIGPK